MDFQPQNQGEASEVGAGRSGLAAQCVTRVKIYSYLQEQGMSYTVLKRGINKVSYNMNLYIIKDSFLQSF